MKKYTAFGLAFMLAIPSMSTVALADGVEPEEEVVEGTEGGETTEQEPGLGLDVINSLSLDTAIERALDDNSSLTLLKYQFEIIESQAGDNQKTLRDLNRDIKDLEDERDDLKEEQRNGGYTFAERLQIQNSLETIEDKLKLFEDTRQQILSGKIKHVYNEEAKRQQIKMETISTFTQLLMSEDQLELQEKALQTKEKEVAKKKAQYDLGVISRDEYNKALREVDIQKADIAKVEKDWTKGMAEFALDLGIAYQPDFSLEPLAQEEIVLVEQEKETNELVEKSYQYKVKLQEIADAEYNREQVYEDEDSTTFQKTEQDLNVELKKEELAQLRTTLEESIRTLYFDVATGYQAISDAERDLNYAKEDYQTLKRQYELGLVARVDYELSAINIDQKELAYELAKQQYFLLTKKVELLEAGVI